MDRTHPDEQGGHLFLGELGEDLREHSASVDGHVAKDLEPSLCRVDPHDPAILGAVASLHQTALLHAIDDAGRAGVGDVHGLGETLHRERPLRLEGRQHIQMDETQGMSMPRFEHASAIAGRPTRHLFEQFALERLTADVVYGLVRGGAPWLRDIQHGIEYTAAWQEVPRSEEHT